MGTPRFDSIHSTRPRVRWARWIVRVMAMLIAMHFGGCTAAIAELRSSTVSEPAPMHRVVQVQLVFGAEADLDLFVTDPNFEEVYFANSKTRLGGELDADRRCKDPAPRTETVRFDPAPAGRYRVTVDFPRRCDDGVDRVRYRVVVDVGSERQEVSGEIDFGATVQVVLEFDAP